MNTQPHLNMRRLFAAILCSVLLSGCAAAAPPSQTANLGAAPAAAPPQSSGSNNAAAIDNTSSADVAARMIVRNATLTLIVLDTQTQLNATVKMATDLGGYVASSSTQKFEEGLQAKVTLRVPADQLDIALDRLHKLAVEVRAEQISGQDVTAEYTDLNSRLTNLQAAELQLREIMSATTRTEDVMTVFNQLTQIRGEIEQTKGRMQFLSQSAAMATIDVTLIPDQLAQPVQVAGWHPEGVAKSAVEALISALQGLATVAIWLIIVVLPVGLVIASPFILVVYLIRRRNRRKLLAKKTN
jgi:Domain of unknown function (DUF4349)